MVLGAQIKSCDEERWSNVATNNVACLSNSRGLVPIRLWVIGSARQVAAAGASRVPSLGKLFLIGALRATWRRAVIEWVQGPF